MRKVTLGHSKYLPAGYDLNDRGAGFWDYVLGGRSWYRALRGGYWWKGTGTGIWWRLVPKDLTDEGTVEIYEPYDPGQ